MKRDLLFPPPVRHIPKHRPYNLVSSLLKIDKKNSYSLFLRKQDYKNCDLKNVGLVQADFPHYSLKEQRLMPGLIKKTGVELMHFPHFNIPIFNRGSFVVTIHDLIKSQFLSLSATTQNPFFYYFKYLNYRLIISKAVKDALKIITPSNFVKEEILKNYQIKPSKIKVVYEGVDAAFSQRLKKPRSKYPRFKKPFLLYVGNLYWHKNLIQLIKVLSLINQTGRLHLVIASKKDKFYQSLKKEVIKRKLEKFVKFLGFVSDKDLGRLYQEALAFINPSLMEGFGLPGLEALSSDCLVLSSDRGSLPEIYKDAAIYFDPENSQDLEKKIKQIISFDKAEKERRVKKGRELVKQYSWQKCAEETLKVYQEIVA